MTKEEEEKVAKIIGPSIKLSEKEFEEFLKTLGYTEEQIPKNAGSVSLTYGTSYRYEKSEKDTYILIIGLDDGVVLLREKLGEPEGQIDSNFENKIKEMIEQIRGIEI